MSQRASERSNQRHLAPDTEGICAEDHQTLLAIPQMYESDSTDNSTSNEISQHWQVEEVGVEKVGGKVYTSYTLHECEGIKGVSVREEVGGGGLGWEGCG